jgi:hypothetical protein
MNENIVPITRPQTGVPQPVTKQESKFPTEVINLPSKGWFYPEDNPLSSGILELKLMTAKEEDILTSRNLIQKGVVLDKLLESLVVNKNIKTDDMLNCDRNASFIAIRRLAYGDEYDAVISCPRCNTENKIKIDLGKMDNRPFEFEKYPKGQNLFEFTLPHSNKIITFKLLSKRDTDQIEAESKSWEKVSKDISKEITTRLKHVILSVDGNADKTFIRQFADGELLSKDSFALRNHMRGMPDIETTFEFSCNNCGKEGNEEMPFGASFFWPTG